MTILRTLILTGGLAALALASATPALADRGPYRGGRGDSTGAAIVGGIVGLAIGAAIASSDRNDRYRDRDDGGYYDGDYGRPRYPRAYFAYRYDRPYPRRWHGGWDHRGWAYRGWDHDDRRVWDHRDRDHRDRDYRDRRGW